MWTASSLDDPVSHGLSLPLDSSSQYFLVHCQASFSSLLLNPGDEQRSNYILTAFEEGDRPARVALADFCSRKVVELFRKNLLTSENNNTNLKIALEPLDYAGSRRKRQSNFTGSHTPYVLERTDIWSTDQEVNVMLRGHVTTAGQAKPYTNSGGDEKIASEELKLELQKVAAELLTKFLGPQQELFAAEAMYHIACVVVQHRLRACLETKEAVAFIADGSILPRKSGANNAPMASPPAVPCEAPSDSTMKQTLQVDLGSLRQFLVARPVEDSMKPTGFSVTGMIVSKGITLVAGGGYHGKSTLLRAVAAGVYDKIPGDGREYCVTVPLTTTIRAEDGRYVQNCNISAFISNLPTLPGVPIAVDTTHFSSAEASGSTSQAANVAEAIEMGAKVFLVDEDVSAANFMARDGRMRALVQDESITPLLYRVNGMYSTLGISCIVVVGGVGDWLDVPDRVILLNRYVASDATKKAKSISKQFSHGHVQYAGKGMVHQLEWEKKGTPFARRPTETFLEQFQPQSSTVSLLDGGHALSVHPADRDDGDATMADATVLEGETIYNDDDDGYIDLSRCEQLMGKKPQLFACGQCVIWLIREAKRNPGNGISDLLSKLDETIDNKGMLEIFAVNSSTTTNLSESPSWKHLLNVSGFAHRPRKYEIGQAFYRMRGMKLEQIPIDDGGEEEAIRQEAENRKRELAEIWEKRRVKSADRFK